MRNPISLVLAFSLLFLEASCVQFGARETPLPVEIERAFPHLKFRRPVLLTHAGDGSDRVFVASQLGKVYVFPNDQNARSAKVFLDIESAVLYKVTENELGFLGLAFHPNFKDNGEFFVYYTVAESPYASVISRFSVSKDDPDKADPNSEEEILRVQQPFWNHKGGTLAFGPDGYLYIALGDGGSARDPYGNGQNLETPLGKILRIDVDHKDEGKNYAIPPDNPFAGRSDARGEIWAYGLRNVWRMAFDREADRLWAADVGQDEWEEINIIERGGNYGWNLREGQHEFGSGGSGPRDDLIDPIWEYHHEVGKCIIGGHVYRGKRVPPLVGLYLYGDYVNGKLWALRYDEDERKVVANYSIGGNTQPIMSFGEDERGEVYFMRESGGIYRFQPRREKSREDREGG